jgi:hypothetical protein
MKLLLLTSQWHFTIIFFKQFSTFFKIKNKKFVTWKIHFCSNAIFASKESDHQRVFRLLEIYFRLIGDRIKELGANPIDIFRLVT